MKRYVALNIIETYSDDMIKAITLVILIICSTLYMIYLSFFSLNSVWGKRKKCKFYILHPNLSLCDNLLFLNCTNCKTIIFIFNAHQGQRLAHM
jgi:hypothetical protein